MRVDWVALGIATVVSIVTSVIFTILLATGIRLVSAAKIKSNEGGSGTATVTLWYIRIGVAGLLVLSGIYFDRSAAPRGGSRGAPASGAETWTSNISHDHFVQGCRLRQRKEATT